MIHVCWNFQSWEIQKETCFLGLLVVALVEIASAKRKSFMRTSYIFQSIESVFIVSQAHLHIEMIPIYVPTGLHHNRANQMLMMKSRN